MKNTWLWLTHQYRQRKIQILKYRCILKLQLRRRTGRYSYVYLNISDFLLILFLFTKQKKILSEVFFICNNSFLPVLQLQTNRMTVYQYNAFLGLQVLVSEMVLILQTNSMRVTHLYYFNTGIFLENTSSRSFEKDDEAKLVLNQHYHCLQSITNQDTNYFYLKDFYCLTNTQTKDNIFSYATHVAMADVAMQGVR